MFVECKWDQRDVVSPKNRTSGSYQPCITTSVTVAAPIPTSPLAQVSGSVQVNNSDSAVGSPTIPNSQSSPASVCGAVSSPAAEDDDEELGKRKTKGRLGGGETRPRTGDVTGRPSGGRLTTVLIEQEGLRLEQEKKIAAELMVFEREMAKEQHANTMQMLAVIGTWFGGGGMGGGGGAGMGGGAGQGGMGVGGGMSSGGAGGMGMRSGDDGCGGGGGMGIGGMSG